MAFESGWYSMDLLPGLDRHDLGGSLYELLAPRVRAGRRHRGADGARGHGRRTLAHHLDVEPGDPLLAFDRLGRSAGAPLERVTSHYRGDRYELHMSLDTTMEGTP